VRLIGYVRCSTEEQGRSGLGLEAQEAAIRGALQACDELVEIRSAVVSGGERRPKVLRSIMEDIEAGHADGLMVSHLDRLTRSMRDFEDLVQWSTDGGHALVVLEPFPIDTSQPGGMFLARVLMAGAEFERGLASRRTRVAIEAKRARGERIGRPLECSAADLTLILKLRDEGLSLSAIARRLNQEGRQRPRGGAWSHTQVRRVLGSAQVNAEGSPQV
jgi:DNA invertase Pin-like site-specific DNA recombinase